MKKQLFMVAAALLLLISGCSGTNSFNPPADVAVKVSASRIELSWKLAPSVIGYNVYRSTTSGAVSTKTAVASGLFVTTWLDSTAIPGTTYYYQVTAYNSTGNSAPSPEVSATIKATPDNDILMGGTLQGVPLVMSYGVTTVAGTAESGSADGSGTSAAFNQPIGITTDGINLFVADTSNNSIRKIVIASGEVTTLAGPSAPGITGTANGIGSAARFNAPYGITTDRTSLFVSDRYNNTIRRINIESREVTTLAGSSTPGSINGKGAAASFNAPRGITTDGTNVYVADSGNRKIRKIVIATGDVTTLAGTGSSGALDGNQTTATFNIPEDLTLTMRGATLFLTDSGNNNIRRIDIKTDTVCEVATLAGSVTPGLADGTGTAASFNAPSGITTDGTNLYVADSKNNIIRKVEIASGVVTKVTGSGSAGHADGDATSATFLQPKGITSDGANLFVVDFDFSLIREIF